MKKQKFNTIQKVVYVLLVIVSVLSILNFFTFGLLFASLLGFAGTMLQTWFCFLFLIIGVVSFVQLEIANDKYNF